MIIQALVTLIREQRPMTRQEIERRNNYVLPYQFDNDIAAAGPAIKLCEDGRYIATPYFKPWKAAEE